MPSYYQTHNGPVHPSIHPSITIQPSPFSFRLNPECYPSFVKGVRSGRQTSSSKLSNQQYSLPSYSTIDIQANTTNELTPE